MVQRGMRGIVIVGLAIVLSGCGGGGVQPGIPSDAPAQPVNPTPDMASPSPPLKEGAPGLPKP